MIIKRFLLLMKTVTIVIVFLLFWLGQAKKQFPDANDHGDCINL